MSSRMVYRQEDEDMSDGSDVMKIIATVSTVK
jgi:hypothetical protein